MTSTRLSLYNGANRIIGARSLSSLTENRESRRVLDGVWNDGAVDFCLEQGFWEFSIRTQMMTYDPSITPEFGFKYAYQKPSDYIRTYGICSDESLLTPITRYTDENNVWYTDYDTIYVQYVSNDDSYGLNYSIWNETFVNFVQLFLASQVCERLTQSASKTDRIEKKYEAALKRARNMSAMNKPARFMPMGTWSSARMFGRFGGINAVLPST